MHVWSYETSPTIICDIILLPFPVLLKSQLLCFKSQSVFPSPVIVKLIIIWSHWAAVHGCDTTLSLHGCS